MSFDNRIRSAVLGLVLSGWLSMVDPVLAQDNQAIATKLSVDEVVKIKNDDDWVVVDARATDAFNGWPLGGAKRGGHIPGAVDFSAGWLAGEQKGRTERLAAALRTKGIDRDKHSSGCEGQLHRLCPRQGLRQGPAGGHGFAV